MTAASAEPPRSTGTKPESVIRPATMALAPASSPHSHCTTRLPPSRVAARRWNAEVRLWNDLVVTRLHLDGIHWRRSTATTSSRDGPARSGRGFGAERNPTRAVFFSDAVFAITVTLLVLEIRPPTDYTNLLHGLVALWPSYLAYALTFLFIGQVWANHQVIFDHIRAANRVILLLNTLLLMIVAFLPFTTSVLAGALRSGHGLRTATVSYGIAFDSTALTFKAVWQYARRHRLLSEALDPADATAIGRRFQLALAWLTTGVPLGLLIPFLGVVVLAAFNVFYWLPIRGESPRPRS